MMFRVRGNVKAEARANRRTCRFCTSPAAGGRGQAKSLVLQEARPQEFSLGNLYVIHRTLIGVAHPEEAALKSARPTDAELAVLCALWQRGPSTVRQVHEVLRQKRDLGYTTVLKALQVMAGKGLVTRDCSERSHVYAPVRTEEQTQRSLVDDLMSRAFGGSAMKLVMQALSVRPASGEELARIRGLLDRAEGGGQ